MKEGTYHLWLSSVLCGIPSYKLLFIFNFFNIYTLKMRLKLYSASNGELFGNAYRFTMQRYFMALLYNLTLLSNRTKGDKNGPFNLMYVAKKIRQTQTQVKGRGISSY